MKLSASAKFVRISPSKVRPFARLLKGRSLGDALASAGLDSSKGAFFIAKLLKSMVANLSAGNLNEGDYHISRVVVEQGPVMKRFWPRSRGMARPVIKRTSHIRIELAENKEKRKE